MKVKERYEEFEAAPFSGIVYIPGYVDVPTLHPTIYLLGSEEKELCEIVRILKKESFWKEREPVLVGIYPGNWNEDYSPFPAPALSSGQPAFGSNAGSYLAALTQTLVPVIEGMAPVLPLSDQRYLVGYSLAGLCALYGAYVSDAFAGYGAVSPSLWLEGWMEYAGSFPLHRHTEKLYLSLGNKESRTKNPRMARVGDCFVSASSYYTSLLGPERFRSELNHGNHFHEPEARLAKAIAFLLSPLP